jgi:hypothetical protein
MGQIALRGGWLDHCHCAARRSKTTSSGNCLSTAAYTQLAVNLLEIPFGRSERDEKALGNLLVRKTIADEV